MEITTETLYIGPNLLLIWILPKHVYQMTTHQNWLFVYNDKRNCHQYQSCKHGNMFGQLQVAKTAVVTFLKNYFLMTPKIEF